MKSTRSVRILSIVMSFFIVIGVVAFNKETVSAATDTTTGLTYTVSSGQATITEFTAPAGFSGTLNIPATLGGATVTAVSFNAFGVNTNLTSINIPSSVTNLPYDCFNGCSSLTAINVDTSNANYKSTDGILYNKTGTRLIRCPRGKTGAFSIPSSVSIIGDDAFCNCTNLSSITIQNSVETIRSSAFYGCTSLSSITIPSSVTNIESKAFMKCSGMTSITFQGSVTYIGFDLFLYCTSLTSFNLNAANTSFKVVDGLLYTKSGGRLIFCPPAKAGDVTILSGITTIDMSTFTSCASITGITLPNSVTSINLIAFTDCMSLSAITIDAANTTYKSVDGILYSKDGSTLIFCPQGKTGSVNLPSGVTTISKGAFMSCPLITNITIPSSVTSISSDSFWCENLVAFTVDAANTTYKSVDGIIYSKDGTQLAICPSGKSGSVTIPSSVTSIWDYAFSVCSNLTSINTDAANTTYKSMDGILYTKDGSTLICCPAGKSGRVAIPNGVMSIKLRAFFGCYKMTSISIPSSVTSIGEYAFYDCSGLTSITIPDSVVMLDWQAFSGCEKLRDAYFLGNAPTMYSSFEDCASDFTVRYLSDKTGFTNPWNGYPTATFTSGITYQTHVQDVGWQDYVKNGEMSGTSAQSKRLEAIRINLEGVVGGIEYRTHVQDIGWQDWVADDALSGTSGQSKRLEAIQIRLTGEAETLYDVYYRVHAQNVGWMGWAKNGESSGTAGYSYRLEAIEVKLVAKGGAAPGDTTWSFINKYEPVDAVLYKTHVQDVGWQGYVANGATSGTSGESKRLEGIQIKLNNIAGGIEYRTHVQDYGWMDWVGNDAMSGTSGQSKRLEAIQIRLTGAAADTYDIYYCVHAQNTGWLDWAKNGQSAGTAGFGYRLEAIQIVLVAKGGPAPGMTARAFVQG